MLIAPGVVMLALAGCGSDEELSAQKVEGFIREEARVPDAIKDVACPEGRKVEEGDTFDCTILLRNGGEERPTVRQEDDEGTVRIIGNRQTKLPRDASQVRIIPENVEDYIRVEADDPDSIRSVDCPADVKLVRGDTFECTVRYADGRAETVEITQVDRLGNVDITGSTPKGGP